MSIGILGGGISGITLQRFLRRPSMVLERDERIAGIVANWARGATSERANALGLQADASFEAIIEQYIEDCRTQSAYPAGALQGL